MFLVAANKGRYIIGKGWMVGNKKEYIVIQIAYRNS